MRPATLLVVALLLTGCSAKNKAALRASLNSVANAADAYARTSDPHIAWCDSHGGFLQRTTESESVQVYDSNTGMPIGTGRINRTYIVCTDGTRIKEM